MNNSNFHVIAEAVWMEGSAISQLRAQAVRPGMKYAQGFPDMQPGKGSPSGAAFVSDLLFPALVGTDIGCGMALWRTDQPIRGANVTKIAQRLDGLDQPWDGDTTTFLNEFGVDPTAFDHSLGTPGYSNHFIEIQKVAEIFDHGLATELGLTPDCLYIMIHSGSRGFGEQIFVDHAAKYGADSLPADSEDGKVYLKSHDHAVAWAKANRRLIAVRVLEQLMTTGTDLIDIAHNAVIPYTYDGCDCWLHRKGAAPADQGTIIIPGSRNALSYVVKPLAPERALASLAHGAGRKISRSDAQGKLEGRYPNRNALKLNQWGGEVVCGTPALLWEEAAECYKDVSAVIRALESEGLIKLIAALHPMVTFKSSEKTRAEQLEARETRQRDRSKARADKRGR